MGLSTVIGYTQQDDKGLQGGVARLGFPFTLKPFPTTSQAVEGWSAGRMGGVLTTAPAAPAQTVTAVGRQFLVVLDQDIREGGFGGRICAASPEQRDILAGLVGREEPADLRLLTQEQYLEDPSCVDVYVTAVAQPSAFLSTLRRPVYLKDPWSGRQGTQAFQAQTYTTTYNTEPVAALPVDMVLSLS